MGPAGVLACCSHWIGEDPRSQCDVAKVEEGWPKASNLALVGFIDHDPDPPSSSGGPGFSEPAAGRSASTL